MNDQASGSSGHAQTGETPRRLPAWMRNPRTVAALVGSLIAIVLLIVLRTDSDRNAAGGEATVAPDMQGMDMGGMSMPTDGSIRLTADQLRQFGVTFGSAEQRVLENEVRTVGIVNVDETRIAEVTLKFAGFVERLYVDFTGQPVRAGQALVEIYSGELVAAQEELLLAARLDANLGQSSVPGVSGSTSELAQLARRRLQLWDITDAQIDQVLETGRVRGTLTLYSPVSGTVLEKPVVRGQAVSAGQTLYRIADLSVLWVEAELREANASAIPIGAMATVALSGFPGLPLAGQVEYVYPTLQSEARTLRARIAIPNPDGRIKPGMYATVQLSSASRMVLSVPTSAVVHTGQRAIVFADLGSGRLMPQEVETGGVSGEYTEILVGVEPGQRVVTSAQYLLDSESNIAEVMRSMIGLMGAGDMGGMDMSGGSMEGMDMPGADMRGMPAPRGRER